MRRFLDLPEKQVDDAAGGEEEYDGGGGPAVRPGEAAQHDEVGFQAIVHENTKQTSQNDDSIHVDNVEPAPTDVSRQ